MRAFIFASGGGRRCKGSRQPRGRRSGSNTRLTGPLASTSFANVAFFASAKHVGAGINEATDIQVARLVLPQSGEESPSSSSASPNWRAMWSSSTGLTASIEDGPPRSRIEVTCRPW